MPPFFLSVLKLYSTLNLVLWDIWNWPSGVSSKRAKVCNALSSTRPSEGNIPVLRICPLGLCSLGHLNLAMIQISEDHLKNFRALVSEILIVISSMGTGNGDLLYYCSHNTWFFFLLLPQFLILCTISPLEDMKFSTLLFGTQWSAWSANYINLFSHLALGETWLSSTACFPCIPLKWWERMFLFPITISSMY